ncbi:siderophore-iron reductase FhuF [Pseudomonas syringae]|nr:siderophore-iron reductase FhuF [Pseudomonas syringae]MBD8574681.1 siderophore-iron reductase FhuF [Pseudomonas syringae]MBD8789243.1 siderophore-iron reductase FhuF [Pseudomonas syringae]MBD8800313.1 siderophore-iron reductase FhuF [Pseudomonas syringae]MBD8810671.1 siderophore-iron reductase FhuF [Pseudomonas syringae]
MNPGMFDGKLQAFGQSVLAHAAIPAGVPLPALLRAERLEALLEGVYGAALMASHKPVLVSQWAKYYFMHLIPPVLAADLAHGWHWPLALADIALALDERGVPVGLQFLQPGAFRPAVAQAPWQRFAALFDDNLQPFIEALSAYGPLPRAVLWSSAGDTLEQCLRHLERIDPALAQDGWPLLRHRRRSEGRANPLFNAVTHVPQADGTLRRQRRSCCLSYQVQWVGRCEHCPLPCD